MAMIYLLTGKVGSGKTHFANNVLPKGTVILSSDELMLTVFDGCLGSEHRSFERKCVKYLLSKALELFKLGISSVIDTGFWYEDERNEAISFLNENGADFKFFYFDVDFDVRLLRVTSRNEKLKNSQKREFIISKEMLIRFDEKYEAPKGDIYEVIKA